VFNLAKDNRYSKSAGLVGFKMPLFLNPSGGCIVHFCVNVGDRQHEDVLEYCESNGLGFIPWYPVAAGKLAQPGGKLDLIAKLRDATLDRLAFASISCDVANPRYVLSGSS
jgi:hypothetical protein